MASRSHFINRRELSEASEDDAGIRKYSEETNRRIGQRTGLWNGF